jgi:hypothetical protein
MSCAIFTFIGLYVLAFNKSNRWALWATVVAAFVALQVATYLAWRDQYRKNEAADSSGAIFLASLEVILFKDEGQPGGAVQIGLVLESTKDRNIEYCVEKSEVVFDGIPLIGNFDNRGGYLFPRKQTTFRFPRTALPKLDISRNTSGTVQYDISYKLNGSEKTHHSKKSLAFDCLRPSGQVIWATKTEYED